MTVALIDYGAGNLASVVKGLRAVGADVKTVGRPEDLTRAEAIVIPGVGHFDATRPLNEEWRNALRARLDAGAGVLGICLGMQWLFDGSEEETGAPGLGVIEGLCTKLSASTEAGTTLKVPHVGWNTLAKTLTASRLLEGVPSGAYAYFTHTYAAPVTAATAATTTHGTTFASVVEHGRVFGTQWHPEKSGNTGLRVLKNFVALAAGGR